MNSRLIVQINRMTTSCVQCTLPLNNAKRLQCYEVTVIK